MQVELSWDQRLPGRSNRDCTTNLHEPSTAPVPVGSFICRKRPYHLVDKLFVVHG